MPASGYSHTIVIRKRLYPDMGTFVIRSFYEKDPEIAADVQDLDPGMMVREMHLASEGYLWELTQRGEAISPERIRKDFTVLIEFWKSVYYKDK